MALVALTQVKHGTGDGNVVVFEPGEPIKDLSDAEVTALVEAGAVADVKVYSEANVGPLEAEIERLRTELEFAHRRLEEKEADAKAAEAIKQPPTMHPETGASVAVEPASTPATSRTAAKKE